MKGIELLDNLILTIWLTCLILKTRSTTAAPPKVHAVLMATPVTKEMYHFAHRRQPDRMGNKSRFVS